MARVSSRTFTYLSWAVLAAFALFSAFPIYWTLNTALKPMALIGTEIPTLYPKQLRLDAFLWVFLSDRARGALIDSLVVAVGSTVLAMIFGTMAGYGFSRFGKKLAGKHVAFWLLSTRMFPPIAIVLPIFFIWNRVGLSDTYLGLILLYLTFNLPLTTWLMRDFFDKIPLSYEEAAYIEGSSRIRTFFSVALPLVKQGLVATTLLAWVFAWNEFLFALMISGTDITPYTTIVTTLGRGNSIVWNRMMAFAFVAALPPVLILVTFRKNIIQGLSLGFSDI
ncbi:carbohydrate ABC transporter permease [Halobacterium sp. KA-4]|uniref:carbohydrate ABC transporter permease n=1 Tax=Halobacterium sp. KA-4 TaxID=2896367 RepID=UPI001E46CAAE|nr:carbohydrate ABC transporter permease [Halobacterium sp. KA-4]MCD2201460.1 carbohydrate ABC transporter permease [Halobacterium sp. KA-4]